MRGKDSQDVASDGRESMKENRRNATMNSNVFHCAQGAFKAEFLFGMAINSIDIDDFFKAIDTQIAGRESGFIVTPNVDHVCRYQTISEFQEAYRKAFLVVPDGVPLMWASRLLGKPLARKISGSDIIFSLTEHSARRGHSVFFLGADPAIAREAQEILEQKYVGLRVAGAYSPPVGFEKDAQENDKIIGMLREAKPDICYLALGTPKQEIWASRYGVRSEVPVMIGVGASLNFVCGKPRRAPRFVQRLGFEWLWRLCQEPRRLWKRYLVDDLKFFGLVWRELRRGRGDKVTLPISQNW